MKKLVRKTKDGRLSEIDMEAMRREALLLQKCVDEAPRAEQQELKYHEWLQPVLDAALDGTLPIPYPDEPYNIHLMLEGLLPQLSKWIELAYATFLTRIDGTPRMSSCSTIEDGHYQPGASEVMIDGERYEWAVFEE